MEDLLNNLIGTIEQEETQDESPRAQLIRCWNTAFQTIMNSMPEKYRDLILQENAKSKEAYEKREGVTQLSPLNHHISNLIIGSWDGGKPVPDAKLTIDIETCERLSKMSIDEYYRGLLNLKK